MEEKVHAEASSQGFARRNINFFRVIRNHSRYSCLIFFICLLLASPVFAQTTADEIETLLQTEAVTYAQAARFILQAADVTVTADPADVHGSPWFDYAARQNWLPKNAAANDTARLDGLALLVMRSFGIKGGICYSLLRSPHYAYRELVYQDIIQGRIDPAMPVSGDALLYMCNRVFSQIEEGN